MRRSVAGRSAAKHSTTTDASWHASSSACLSSGREEVSVMTTGTPSGVVSAGSLAGGRTGGGWSGKVSVAAAVIRLVLPTPSSPTTQMCTVLGPAPDMVAR
jgi:hypothetical protein